VQKVIAVQRFSPLEPAARSPKSRQFPVIFPVSREIGFGADFLAVSAQCRWRALAAPPKTFFGLENLKNSLFWGGRTAFVAIGAF
jgi:hypothetical protein